MFYDFLKVVSRRIEDVNIQHPVLLLFDGHASHVTLRAAQFCEEKDIILYSLHPHASHIHQPCDLALFGPMKQVWKEEVGLHKWQLGESFLKKSFPTVFKKTWQKTAIPENAVKGFQKAGIYPFNPAAIDLTRYTSLLRPPAASSRSSGHHQPAASSPSSGHHQPAVSSPSSGHHQPAVPPPATTSQQSAVPPPATTSQQSLLRPPPASSRSSGHHQPAASSHSSGHHQPAVTPPATTSQQPLLRPPPASSHSSGHHQPAATPPATTSQQPLLRPPPPAVPPLATSSQQQAVPPLATTSQQSLLWPPPASSHSSGHQIIDDGSR